MRQTDTCPFLSRSSTTHGIASHKHQRIGPQRNNEKRQSKPRMMRKGYLVGADGQRGIIADRRGVQELPLTNDDTTCLDAHSNFKYMP